MSLYTLRLMSQATRAEEDAVDAAVDSFRNKQLPAFSQIFVKRVGLQGGKIVVDAEWKNTRYSATASIDPKSRSGSLVGRQWISYTSAEDQSALSKKDAQTILKVVNAKIDDGVIAASRELRAAIAVALRGAR